MNKNQISNLESMSVEELEISFCRVVLKKEITQAQSSGYRVCSGTKEAWLILREQLMSCQHLITTKTQLEVNNELKEKFFVAFVLAGNDETTIASGETQALATVKALILAHSGQYMTAKQLKELRLAIKKRNGKPLTQAEFGTKTGNHTQQAQYDFEIGRRPVPGALAGEAFQLFQKSITFINVMR